jgi:xanthine dehydrogenase accessory factor
VSLQSEFAHIAATDGRAALVTVISGAGLGAKLLVRADGSGEGSLGSEELDREARSLFVDVVAPAPRLVVFGALDYAAALCRLARAAGWRPYVCDPRSQFATPERFPGADEVIVAWPEEAFARLGGIDRATYIAILTHDPKLDDAALSIALQSRRRERLLAAGLDEELLDRMAAPIGLDLGAVSPEETALSIMSEVVAVRNGREGGRLSRSAGRIHEVGA